MTFWQLLEGFGLLMAIVFCIGGLADCVGVYDLGWGPK